MTESSQDKIIDTLIDRGQQLLEQPYKRIRFTKDDEADDLLNNLKEFPHAFVLACIMDRQIKAEKAWRIPYKIAEEMDGFEFSRLDRMNLEDIIGVFRRKKLHRFNDTMARNFHEGINKIRDMYQGDACRIWRNKPKSATVVRRFLEFKGIGRKIATMAANILARDFKVPLEDYASIDVSIDVNVNRVFKRLGVVSQRATYDEIVYRARELSPDYPGIFDLPCWRIGARFCKATDPQCQECFMDALCPKMTL